jgi:superfamily II DNA or RNA helicase
MSLDSIFEAVRRACPPAVWSRGVELSRADAVTVEGIGDDEAVFLVSQRGGMISRTVRLYPDEGDWDCACSRDGAPCEHLAAAVIAWKRSREEGRELREGVSGPGRVGYRFSRADGALALERVVVAAGQEHPLRSTLAAMAAGRVAGPPFVASQADLAAELALGTHRRGRLPRGLVEKVLRRLAHCSDVTLDGAAVRAADRTITPRVCVDDQGEGFRLALEDDATVSERFTNGIALCDDILCAVGEARLTGRELQELGRGRGFSSDQVGQLVTTVLPDLKRRVPVEIRTARLPRATREPPRITLLASREGESLRVQPAVVYGDPPRARVDGGRLVHLRDPVPVRDEAAERRLVGRLRRELQLTPGVRARFDGEEAVAFAARLGGWARHVEGDALASFRLAPPLVPELTLRGDRLELGFESTEGPDGGAGAAGDSGGTGRRHGAVAADQVLRVWREGGSLVPLAGGGWAPLPKDWLARFGHRVADLLAAREENGRLPTCCLPDLARLCDELDRPAPPGLDRLRALLDAPPGDAADEGSAGIPAAELPGDLAATLRGYQRAGVDWLAFLRRAGLGGLLADDMGLGKTLQALCAIDGRALVVAPTSVLHNWIDEARRFRPSLRTHLYHGPARALQADADVTLTSYALLRLDVERLAEVPWDTVVLDESQAIKNPESRVAAAAFRLQARHRVALTGTPVENRLGELWSQFHFVNRGLLGGRRDFQERYAEPIAAGDAEAAARLRERIRPFVLRRLKREVAPELPPRTEMELHCELTPAERDVYDAIRLTTRDEVVRKLREGGGVLAALEALLRLRQACCHAALVPGQSAESSSKLELLVESLENVVAEGHKALVFSQWTGLLDLCEPRLGSAGIPFTRLDGSTRDRAGVVRGFQDPAGPPLMLISLKAGGTGLNLTAADHVFLLDPWWNPAVEDQAADRVHRIGQERPVMVYRLVAEATVEERILLLQRRKRELARAALDGADGAAGIGREELLELLG